MRILEIKNKGAIPFPEEIVWKPGDDQKIAIIGDNGSGKTTLLDTVCMAFYGITPNRKSESGRDEGAIYGCFTDKKSYIEVKVFLKGQEIHVKRLIDPISKTQKPYLYVNGKAVTEGKVKEFDKEFLKVTGISQEIFLSTIYHSQKGKGHLSSLNQSDSRQLLDQFLGFGEYDREFSLADKERKILEDEIKGDQFAITELRKKIEKKEETQKLRSDLELEKSTNIKNIESCEFLQKNSMQRIADLKSQNTDVKESLEKKKKLETEKATLTTEITDIQERLKNNQTLLDKAPAIRKADMELKEVNALIEIIEKEIVSAKSQYETEAKSLRELIASTKEKVASLKLELTVKTTECTSFTTQISGLDTRIAGLNSTLESLKSKAELLDRVPCSGVTVGDKVLSEECELLKDAVEGKKKIVTVEQDIAVLEKQKAEIQEKLNASQKEKEACELSISSLEETQIKTEKTLENLPLLKAIEQKETTLTDLRKKVPILQEESKNIAHLDLAEERIKDYEAKLVTAKNKCSDIEQEINNLQVLLDSKDKETQAIETAESELDQINIELADLRKLKDEIIAKITTQVNSLKEIEESEIRLDKLLQSPKAQRLTYLKLLCEGLSPKGARALKLDAAGPGISASINGILEECYGSRFQVRLQTTKETGKGDLREEVSLMVLDEETGEESLVDNKSGGQAAIIKEGISLGAAVYQQQQSGADIRTLIRDEADGGLTPKNAHLYQKMLDKAMLVGGFEQVIYVSHKHDIQKLADKVYLIEKGKIFPLLPGSSLELGEAA
ncbi:AAA family ATPase [Leptospira sp. GIMC2001]|uniref:AAA family ATPase n=1 Tax=Leptospira sp. GIMC2001 TaxID=1513297 RepID=UPI0023495A60|nr:endonuclease [Leptospira sp. GIMC2001]WCL51455.1 endonuclease [Leptospira sp. GIMC2001]